MSSQVRHFRVRVKHAVASGPRLIQGARRFSPYSFELRYADVYQDVDTIPVDLQNIEFSSPLVAMIGEELSAASCYW